MTEAEERNQEGLENAGSLAELKKMHSGVNIKKFDKKYKLEGLVATYASTPRQTGDYLTPDHQPQASLLKQAAESRSAT